MQLDTRRRDHREGTIEEHAEYKAFLEELDKPVEKLPSAEAWLNEQDKLKEEGKLDEDEPALVTFLRAKRQKKMADKRRARERKERDRRDRTKKRREKEKTYAS